VPKLSSCGLPRFYRVHASGEIVFGERFKMPPDILSHLRFEVFPTEYRRETKG
jgi:hypothetical protein